MTEKPTLQTSLKPLALAAIDLVEICEQIDTIEEIDDLVDAKIRFDVANNVVTEAIDRRKYLLAEVASKKEIATKQIEKMQRAIEVFKKIENRVMESTLEVMLANTNIPFKDSLGKKLSIREFKSVEVSEGWEGTEYSRIKVTKEANKKKMAESLKEGKELDFAKFVTKKKVYGLT